MAFKTSGKTVHNKGGVRGLAVKFTGALETKLALSTLPAKVQKKVLRQAVAAAGRPVLKTMRAEARAYSASSRRKEGIGTTSRSLHMKVATSKKDPSVAYALIGARRGYVEFAYLRRDGSIKEVHKASKIRSFWVRRRRSWKSVEFRKLKHMGPVARKARLRPTKGAADFSRRVPTRYLHLIEKGGKTRSVRPGQFMVRAARSQTEASRAKFAEVMDAGIKREFSRMAAK